MVAEMFIAHAATLTAASGVAVAPLSPIAPLIIVGSGLGIMGGIFVISAIINAFSKK